MSLCSGTASPYTLILSGRGIFLSSFQKAVRIVVVSTAFFFGLEIAIQWIGISHKKRNFRPKRSANYSVGEWTWFSASFTMNGAWIDMGTTPYYGRGGIK
jgi:hypothetical protein